MSSDLYESPTDNRSEKNMLIQPANEELNIHTEEHIQVSKSAGNFENCTPEENELKTENSESPLPYDDLEENMKENDEENINKSAPSVQLKEGSIGLKGDREIKSHSKPMTMRKKYYYEKKYDCAQCDSKFTHKKGFLVHKQSKHEGMKFVCHECSKQFVQKGHLARHRRIRH